MKETAWSAYFFNKSIACIKSLGSVLSHSIPAPITSFPQLDAQLALVLRANRVIASSKICSEE